MWRIAIKKIPNTKTSKTLQETDNGIRIMYCKNLDELFKKLGI